MATYSDLNLAFLKHPNTRDVVKTYDLEAVKASVRSLIRTNRGEKLFKPHYGGDLRSMLFENQSTISSELLKRRWNEMLTMYEPRAIIEKLSITYENSEMYILLELALRYREDVKFVLPLSVTRIR